MAVKVSVHAEGSRFTVRINGELVAESTELFAARRMAWDRATAIKATGISVKCQGMVGR